jgi:hypothetical protein
MNQGNNTGFLSRSYPMATVFHSFGRLAQQATGVAGFLAGSTMLFTFWLIPVGLPLAFLGLALISNPHSA